MLRWDPYWAEGRRPEGGERDREIQSNKSRNGYLDFSYGPILLEPMLGYGRYDWRHGLRSIAQPSY